MSIGLAVVLTIINFVGILLIWHVFKQVRSYYSVLGNPLRIQLVAFATLLLFSGAVAANTFISAVSKTLP
jgi:hypothetical protein